MPLLPETLAKASRVCATKNSQPALTLPSQCCSVSGGQSLKADHEGSRPHGGSRLGLGEFLDREPWARVVSGQTPRQTRLIGWFEPAPCEVSTWRGRPRLEVIGGGGAGGGGAAGSCAACSQAAQQGLRVQPGNGLGSLERLHGGGRGLDGF
jgi:hypothetical protein